MEKRFSISQGIYDLSHHCLSWWIYSIIRFSQMTSSDYFSQTQFDAAVTMPLSISWTLFHHPSSVPISCFVSSFELSKIQKIQTKILIEVRLYVKAIPSKDSLDAADQIPRKQTLRQRFIQTWPIDMYSQDQRSEGQIEAEQDRGKSKAVVQSQ